VNPLAGRLRERIAASGPISFSAFMESALYDAQDGFYARGARLGAAGAFTTAPIAAPFLTRALAA
jgi:SAM-dependent MidA family methyltransferase